MNELRDITKRTKAVVISILESKLDSTVLDSEVYIENYEILRKSAQRRCCLLH